MTSCVVGDFRRIRSDRPRRSTLRIRQRSEVTCMANDTRNVRETLADREGETGSREEGSRRVLEGGDRTVGIRKGSLQMGEHVRRRGPACRFRRRLGRRTPSEQGCANRALAAIESLPDALQGSVAQMAVGGPDRGGDAVGRGASEERPQLAARQAQSPDFVREPNAERATATTACMAIAAKDPPSPYCFSPGTLLVKPEQEAVPNQRADRLAAGTRRLLEPLGDRDPFAFVAIKPTLDAHDSPAPPKIADFTGATKSEVEAGYERTPGVRGARYPSRAGSSAATHVLPNSRRNRHRHIGRQFGKITPKNAIRAWERTPSHGHVLSNACRESGDSS